MHFKAEGYFAVARTCSNKTGTSQFVCSRWLGLLFLRNCFSVNQRYPTWCPQRLLDYSSHCPQPAWPMAEHLHTTTFGEHHAGYTWRIKSFWSGTAEGQGRMENLKHKRPFSGAASKFWLVGWAILVENTGSPLVSKETQWGRPHVGPQESALEPRSSVKKPSSNLPSCSSDFSP